MKPGARREHSIDTLFSVLLFGLFVLFLLLAVLFSAKAYQSSVAGLEENDNLRTAMAYVTTKFRQHDDGSAAFETNEKAAVLCLKDVIDDETYDTYIYLQDGMLKELFTASGSAASRDMGTPIAALKTFGAEEAPGGFYRITLEDTMGRSTSFLLHAGVPGVTQEELCEN